MMPNTARLLSAGVVAALLAACGGGGGGGYNSTMPVSQTGNVSMMISDASSEDWATIGVKVLSIALVPQGGGSNVTVYTAPATVPLVILAQLDAAGGWDAQGLCAHVFHGTGAGSVAAGFKPAL
jgi:hypothetical protein